MDKIVSFDLPEYTPSTFGLPWHKPRTFRVRLNIGQPSDYIRERIWADEQKVEETDGGGVTLEVPPRSEPELMAWVRSFGKEAELLP